MNKSFQNLLKPFFSIPKEMDCFITGLSFDHRAVQPGDLFFACRGLHHHGKEFIDEAIARGARAILVEEEGVIENRQGVPIVADPKLSEHLYEIAAKFYDYPARDLKVIGVTGTNGKTSCTHFIAQALQKLGKQCGIIGTLGNGLYGQLHPGTHTTPHPISLQKFFAEIKEAGAEYVAMEVSSHGLSQNRMGPINFVATLLTNVTRDHLDYHETIENYTAAKRRLFFDYQSEAIVLNAEDDHGRQWLNELSAERNILAYAIQDPHLGSSNILYTHHTHFNAPGFTASLHTPWGGGVLNNSHLIGKFNLSNLLGVLGVLKNLGFSFESSLTAIGEITGVPGRLETLKKQDHQPLVVIDYAHTPDALAKVLDTLAMQTRGKLWCVFGCGGDRDRGKRPEMGHIAETLADEVVITDDNPRHEESKMIISDIMTGVKNKSNVVIEHNRRRAIQHAISCAKPEDIVLIAGKGHESVQIIGDERLPFSDSFEAQWALTNL